MGGVSSRYHNRSKTPSGQNSISQSLELLNDSVSIENRDVRIANILKNPFRVSQQHEEARAFTPNRSCVQQKLKKRVSSANHLATRTFDYYRSFGLNSFETREVLQEGSPNPVIYKTYSGREAEYHQNQYVEERTKHEATKRALNKAIKLANLLLDEITREQTGCTSAKRHKKKHDLDLVKEVIDYERKHQHTPT